MPIYKCRFECIGDVYHTLSLLTKHIETYRVIRDPFFPDVEVEFDIPNAELQELVDILKTGMDLHVAYQSLELLENYTGVRKRR